MGDLSMPESRPIVAVVTTSNRQTLRYTLPSDANVSAVASAVENDEHMAPSDQRLIANGRELGMDEKLETLGEFWFRKNSILVLPVDKDACREWQRTGRCSLAGKCPHKASHDMDHSP